VRAHRARDRHFDARAALREIDPARLEDAAAVLHGHQRPPLARLGKLDQRLVAYGVLGLVGVEAEHARAGPGLLLRAPGPGRPVDVERLAGAVAAFGVAGAH